jgi:hypothetical protein
VENGWKLEAPRGRLRAGGGWIVRLHYFQRHALAVLVFAFRLCRDLQCRLNCCILYFAEGTDSVTVRNWSALVSFKVCTIRLGQVISISLIEIEAPNPKCRRLSLED